MFSMGGMSMERLTKKYGSGIIPHKFGIACSVYCDNCSVGSGNCDDARNMIKRLAEIEDILGDDYDLDRLETMMTQCMSMREEVAERFKITSSISVERLRELVEAYKDGRCVVLPCKIGDVLYRVKQFKKNKDSAVAKFITEITLNKNNFWRIIFEGELGKTVFLNYEDAKAALEGVRNGKEKSEKDSLHCKISDVVSS